MGEKIDFFWYNCGLHGKKKNHLLRNLFFYASAVNVHIVAVRCSMENSGPVCCGDSVSVREKNRASRNIQKHQCIPYFTEGETAETLLVPFKGGTLRKGILRVPCSQFCHIHWSTDIGKTTKRTSSAHSVITKGGKKKSCWSYLFSYRSFF